MYFSKTTLFAASWALICGALAASLPARDAPPSSEGLKVVTYDGPLYTMTPEDLARLDEARRTGAPYEKPEGMPVIDLEPGTLLDMGRNNTLGKRSGQHLIGACSDSGCGGTTIAQVKDFGCGTGCISMSQYAYSGFVFQEYHGNPYPTMDVWHGIACSGSMQHFGVENTYSCTNSNTNGYYSFIGYYDCHH